jgi:N-acetylglucosamine malate deacetylase 1
MCPTSSYTAVLVQDSAFMVTVPFWVPDVPYLKRNPVFLYTSDRFRRPNPFTADVAVGIDEVIEPTLDALLIMESQIHEGGAPGDASLFPDEPAARKRRSEQVRTELARRYQREADNFRDVLVKFYGEAKAKQIRYAQAFEICEYGRQPTQAEMKQLFPF